MYYHIKLDYFDSKQKIHQTRFSYDISDGEYIKKVAASYLKDKSLIFEGAKLKAEDVLSVEIFESDSDINTCIAIANKELSSPFFFYDKASIFEREDLIKKVTRNMFEEIQSNQVDASIPHQPGTTLTTNNSKRVFIVHGHDNTLRLDVEMTIKQLGLQPIVLFKQADRGATIIEKLERECSDVAFCIVLYTPCDHGCEIDKNEYRPRARQNVVFEHGMMVAKLGRSRVVALIEKGVEIPGDLSGVIYKEVDPRGHWKLELVGEMQAANLDVDANNLLKN